MAVNALLVALEAQVHLQGLNFATLQSITIQSGDPFFKIVHRPPPDRLL
jgi:hypothetical protein